MLKGPPYMTQIPATLQEIVHAMPQYANADAIKGVNKTVQFNFSGEEPGSYYLVLQDGTVTAHEGTADAADVTVDAPSEVWKSISTGDTNGAVAFMMGKFKASGDITLLMAMQNWFDIPR
jgi:putative sterol carrier protein